MTLHCSHHERLDAKVTGADLSFPGEEGGGARSLGGAEASTAYHIDLPGCDVCAVLRQAYCGGNQLSNTRGGLRPPQTPLNPGGHRRPEPLPSEYWGAFAPQTP